MDPTHDAAVTSLASKLAALDLTAAERDVLAALVTEPPEVSGFAPPGTVGVIGPIDQRIRDSILDQIAQGGGEKPPR